MRAATRSAIKNSHPFSYADKKNEQQGFNNIHHRRSHLENTRLCPKMLSEKQFNIVNKIVVLRKKITDCQRPNGRR